MTIPTRRILASNWVLQFALITFILNLWNTPYNACIIAHERMTAFAYIGIFEGLVYLLIALGIKVSPIDNLIFYSSLIRDILVLCQLIWPMILFLYNLLQKEL